MACLQTVMYLKKLRLYPTLFITFNNLWSEAGFGFLLKNLKNVLLMFASKCINASVFCSKHQ